MTVLPFNGVWPKIADDVFVAEGAKVIGDVTIGEGSSVWYNAVLRGDIAPIVIGRRSNIQDNCTVHVDDEAPTRIGDDVTIGHGAIVHGATIEDRALIAINAVVLTGARIGQGSIVGAGAVVSPGTNVPAMSLVLGVPGKVRRKVTDAEGPNEAITRADGYRQLGQAHRKSRPRERST